MIWFVDLSLHPHIRITHRAVPSCAPEVAVMDESDSKRSASSVRDGRNRCIPESTESRFWVRAQSASEALRIAQERAGR